MRKQKHSRGFLEQWIGRILNANSTEYLSPEKKIAGFLFESYASPWTGMVNGAYPLADFADDVFRRSYIMADGVMYFLQ